MEEKHLIPAGEFCRHYQVESSFISALQEYGLIELQIVEEQPFIYSDHLADLEKFIHLHYELNINMEGIDAISHLLARFTSLQNEVAALRNRLRIYE